MRPTKKIGNIVKFNSAYLSRQVPTCLPTQRLFFSVLDPTIYIFRSQNWYLDRRYLYT